MQYRKDKYGEELSILGFGCMRFTKKGGAIDIAEAEREIMEAYNSGVNYFDTAYIYSGSEAAVGEIFERNGIRGNIKIATKLPQYLVGSKAALDRYFDEQLSRLRTDYVDYYLMHHMTDIAMFIESKSLGRYQYAQTVGLTKESAFATQCIECGKCEQHCPQQLHIRKLLKEADKALRPLPYKIGINVVRKFMFRKSGKNKHQEQ